MRTTLVALPLRIEGHRFFGLIDHGRHYGARVTAGTELSSGIKDAPLIGATSNSLRGLRLRHLVEMRDDTGTDGIGVRIKAKIDDTQSERKDKAIFSVLHFGDPDMTIAIFVTGDFQLKVHGCSDTPPAPLDTSRDGAGHVEGDERLAAAAIGGPLIVRCNSSEGIESTLILKKLWNAWITRRRLPCSQQSVSRT